MPKILTRKNRSARSRKEYQTPHSPWQKLIDGQRLKFGLSFRDVAGEIGIHPGTFWIWLHSKNGHPHPKSCKPQHLTALARILKLPLAAIKDALDASRHLYTAQETPTPQPASDVLDTLIVTLKNMDKRMILRSTVINLAERLKAGIPIPPAPSSIKPS